MMAIDGDDDDDADEDDDDDDDANKEIQETAAQKEKRLQKEADAKKREEVSKHDDGNLQKLDLEGWKLALPDDAEKLLDGMLCTDEEMDTKKKLFSDANEKFIEEQERKRLSKKDEEKRAVKRAKVSERSERANEDAQARLRPKP